MKFGSLFSGIGGFDLGFERAGMECAWQVEIDRPCLGVLDRHWPGVEKYHDIRDVGYNLEPVDLICGGFPCQDLSVAGRRAGLAGERSGLWFEFARVIGELKPGWVVIENVPGLLSSHRGADFSALLSGLVEFGYGVAWRTIDAQYFGVAQRRRRVFIVGSLGNGRVAEVLFERESGGWDTAPGRETGEGIAGAIAPGSHPGGITQYEVESGNLVSIPDPAYAINGQGSKFGSGRNGQDTFIALSMSENQRAELRLTEISSQLTSGGGKPGQGYPAVVAWHENKGGSFTQADYARALRSGASHSYQGVGVRRLTPTECERLQGFPDGWTGGQADSARYRQLGNAVAVPCAEWLGRRIVEAENG